MKFRHLVFLLLPVWLFDGCLNRDPLYYVAPACYLGAAWSGEPLSLTYRPQRVGKSGKGYEIQNVTFFRLGPKVFTGHFEGAVLEVGQKSVQTTKLEKGFFIVDRDSNQVTTFETQAERDNALERQYGTSITQLRQLSWGWARERANYLFPYNWVFYGSVWVVFVISYVRRRRLVQPPTQAPSG